MGSLMERYPLLEPIRVAEWFFLGSLTDRLPSSNNECGDN